MKIATISIFLAKEIFQVYDVNRHGMALPCTQLRRSNMTKFFTNLEFCLLGMKSTVEKHTAIIEAAAIEVNSRSRIQ